MPAPQLSAADFLSALHNLLPSGRVWPRESDATQSKALAGLTGEFADNTARGAALVADAFPPTTSELLPEWEETLGLPDPCAGEQPTIAARVAQVIARFIGAGGQSIPFLIAYAASLGFVITITESAPFRMGVSGMGDALGGSEWFFVWTVHAPLDTFTQFIAGRSVAGDPLFDSGNAVLECEMQAVRPAHTILQFQYS
ncbi:MAG TPA: putative phage tail protein [Rhizomicrobium sp.]|jgi:uncharacterized protein YmfQ (DUF2313 family)|nr:putative phage tail protein [Rhizomicrobium sp.]